MVVCVAGIRVVVPVCGCWFAVGLNGLEVRGGVWVGGCVLMSLGSFLPWLLLLVAVVEGLSPVKLSGLLGGMGVSSSALVSMLWVRLRCHVLAVAE